MGCEILNSDLRLLCQLKIEFFSKRKKDLKRKNFLLIFFCLDFRYSKYLFLFCNTDNIKD